MSGPLELIEDEWDAVERIVAVGDLHGDYGRYMEALSGAGLVDSESNWVAGRTHFVQMGDIPDRGPDSARIIRHMQVLEKQAVQAGGRVHALIGNHEVMNMSGRLHYVHPGEYEALCGDQATELRDAYHRDTQNNSESRHAPSLYDYAIRRSRRARHEVPLGFVEHQECWSLEGEFGSWVARHNAVIRLNDVLFVHGGISPKYLDWSIRGINQRVRAELHRSAICKESILEDPLGPLWYRGLALDDGAAEPSFVGRLLEAYGVEHIVIGHTPCCETIVPRYGGRVLVIDSGISSFYGGSLAVLLLEGSRLINLQMGERVVIPVGNADVLDYFRAIVELEPDSVSLRELVSTLELGEREQIKEIRSEIRS